MIRLFAALAIPPDLAQGLIRRQNSLPGARWRPPEALHITLRFFGEVQEEKADDLDVELEKVAGHAPKLELIGVGAFGEGADIHAVWAGVAKNEALDHLAHACEAAARRAGLDPEHRAYRPHVTLAYLRKPDPDRVARWIQSHNLLHSPAFEVPSFGLYSSRQTEAGSRYTLEREYML